jgi:hypothetical protein
VGTPHLVPPYLTLFEDQLIAAPYAGADQPLCDRKEVILSDQMQAAADFFLFTSTPVASHFTGMVLDDLSQEFNPNSPQFGEKWAPPFVPVRPRLDGPRAHAPTRCGAASGSCLDLHRERSLPMALPNMVITCATRGGAGQARSP